MSQKNNTIYLSTGSNMGDRESNLKKANALIEKQIGKITLQSRLYETEAWGNTEQDSFLNQALEVKTTLAAAAVLKEILKIEESLGRVRKGTEKWSPRSIDIDILLYGEEIINTPDLTIPHPHLHERNFVLVPLTEIAGETLHPIIGETIEDIYFSCTDPQEVLEWEKD